MLFYVSQNIQKIYLLICSKNEKYCLNDCMSINSICYKINNIYVDFLQK